MPMRPDDRILSTPRGSREQAIAWLNATQGGFTQQVYDYLTEVYRLAPLVGIDPAIVIAQSAEETGNWTSDPWRNHLNPAGIGITDGQDFGYVWKDGTDAARGQIVHLWLYAAYEDAMEPTPILLRGFFALDPRVAALMEAGWNGTIRTIRDLTGKWATDPAYHDKIAARGNLIFPDLVDQEG